MSAYNDYDEQDERHEILLETGTNEVEILEFLLRDQSFGVNVAKIKQIIQYEPEHRNEVPEAPPAMLGVYLHRDSTIPLIDLGKALKMKEMGAVEKPLVMVCEFNKVVCGFYIDGVKRIHRLSWTDIQPMNEMLSKQSSCIISSVNIDSSEVLIVDLEHIISAMGIVEAQAPEHRLEAADATGVNAIRIILAEDSNFIRNQMIQFLRAGGFENIEDYSTGRPPMKPLKNILPRREKKNGRLPISLISSSPTLKCRKWTD